MSDGSLTQQEIDALLAGSDDDLNLGDDESSEESAPKPASKSVPAPRAKKSDRGNFENIELLMDVQMQMSVELGRTKMLVKDVLDLAEGSIVELNKFSGEPVDILVNNRLVGRGEVVAIDESFGVKVTEVIDPEERLKVGM